MRLEEVRLIHAIPGRVRFRLDTIKGRGEQAQSIQRQLASVRGMHRVEANPLTGSVLVEYDPTHLENLDFHLAVARALNISPSELDPAYLAGWYAKRAKGNDGIAMDPTAILSNIRTLVPLSLVALGVRGLLATERITFPAWYDYFWFAFASYFSLNPLSKSV